MTLVILAVSFFVSLVGVPLLLPRLSRAHIVGRDLHKPDQPEVPEMGGLAVIGGFGAGILLALALKSFFHLFPDVDLVLLLAPLATILLTGLIGIADDLLGMHQWVKALVPMFAALPLMAVRAGHSWMRIPFFGAVDFSIFYPLVLVPIGVTVAANAVNMLAGFNGLETGMGIIALGSLAIITATLRETGATILLLSGIGALLGVLWYNRHPARILVGDVGTLSIGAILAAAVIIGNIETAGVILLIPYAVDFLFKAAHGFPTRGWGGELGRDGRLRCPAHGPVSLCQAVMRVTGGLRESSLVLLLVGVEAVCGIVVVLLYARF